MAKKVKLSASEDNSEPKIVRETCEEKDNQLRAVAEKRKEKQKEQKRKLQANHHQNRKNASKSAPAKQDLNLEALTQAGLWVCFH